MQIIGKFNAFTLHQGYIPNLEEEMKMKTLKTLFRTGKGNKPNIL